MLDALTKVARGVKHVRSEYEVELYFRRWLLNVQRAISHEWILSELLLRLRQEPGRNVRKDVFRPIRWEVGQDRSGRSAHSSADLQDSRCSACASFSNETRDCRTNRRIRDARCRRFLVQSRRVKTTAGWKQQFKRIDLASQDFVKTRTAPLEHP